jgi:hypothetical protein
MRLRINSFRKDNRLIGQEFVERSVMGVSIRYSHAERRSRLEVVVLIKNAITSCGPSGIITNLNQEVTHSFRKQVTRCDIRHAWPHCVMRTAVSTLLLTAGCPQRTDWWTSWLGRTYRNTNVQYPAAWSCLTGSFRIQSGFKQGDALSPLLLTLVCNTALGSPKKTKMNLKWIWHVSFWCVGRKHK